jgi:hypothetical protein
MLTELRRWQLSRALSWVCPSEKVGMAIIEGRHFYEELRKKETNA